MTYEWKDGQLYDTDLKRYVIWKTVNGYLDMNEDMKYHIARVLNEALTATIKTPEFIPHWLSDAEMEKLPPYKTDDPYEPVIKYGSVYYFWNETWTECYGPFFNKQEADDACREYARTI